MNIAVIGLGSMGKRRIRLLQQIDPSFVIFGVDGREDRRLEAKQLFGIETFSLLNDVPNRIECAFVCTSPLSHQEIIQECLRKGWHVFTELNLVEDGYESNMALAKEKNLALFLSSTFLYREEIQYIRNRVKPGEQWNYVYHIGQYLPDWHPWESYQSFFLGDHRTNGCREILAIELPWIVGTFGEVKDIHANSDKMSALKINYHDNFMIQIIHKNGNKGCLIVDVVSPVAVRKLEAYGEERYISWNGVPESLTEFNEQSKKLEQVTLTEEAEHQEGYRAFVIENAYRNEIQEFFDVIQSGKKPLYGFEQDREILRLIDSIGA